MKYADEAFYKGCESSDQPFDGRVALKNINGAIFGGQIGNIKNGLFSGKGTFKSSHGFVYEGYWKNGEKHGKGT